MQWVEPRQQPHLPPQVMLAMARQLAARRPDCAETQLALADALFEAKAYAEAAELLEACERLGGEAGPRRRRLAECLRQLRQPERAIAVARQALAAPDVTQRGGLEFVVGMALSNLGRYEEADEAFFAELANNPLAFAAAEMMLMRAAQARDGRRLLEICERLDGIGLQTCAVLGYRAIALSLLGANEAARTIMDLDKYVWRKPLEPPPGFDDMGQFNAALQEEIARNSYLHSDVGRTFRKTEVFGFSNEPALHALKGLMRRVTEEFLQVLTERNAMANLIEPSEHVDLHGQANIVLEDDIQPAHLHKYAFVSGVYHAVVPPSVAKGADGRGALVLGSLEGLVDEHEPAWEAVAVKPVPGTAIFFAPHIFHSVRPSQTSEPRVAVAFNLVRA